MRDPDRIPELCALLERAWRLDPDMRLGQLIVCAIRPSTPCPQIFHPEDSHTQRGLERFIARCEGKLPAAYAPRPDPDRFTLSWAERGPAVESTVRLESAREAQFDCTVPGPHGAPIASAGHILELRYVGEYRPGSQGKPDAAAMRAAMLPHVLETCPDVVLFDFSELDYSWGDGILGLLQTLAELDRDEPMHAVVLAGEGSWRGLDGLLVGAMFRDRQHAVNEAKRLAYQRCVQVG